MTATNHRSLPAVAANNPFISIAWGTPAVIYRTLERAPVLRVEVSKDYRKLGTFSGGYQTELWKKKVQARTAMALKVKKFKDLVEAGTPVERAAEATHETVKTLLTKTRETYGREVQDTLEAYGWLPTDVKREYVRAKQLQVMDLAFKAVQADPTDAKMLKVALDASRAVGEDRDIALFQAPKVAAKEAIQPAISPVLAALIGGGEEEKEPNA